MPFEYSCFISYRRQQQRNIFIENFCEHFNTFAFDACNKQVSFVDTERILVGDNFPEKIFNSIKSSHYFLVIHNYHYLNKDNIWCAKELKYALDVEKARIGIMKDTDKDNYNWIIPLIIRGKTDDLPQVLKDRNVKHIGKYEAVINSKSPLPQEVLDIFNELYEKMISLYKIHEHYTDTDFDKCCKDIQEPDDIEIIKWIREQRNNNGNNESDNPPILTKDDD